MINEYKRLTKKQASYWLSEAWGQHIPEKNVRLRGDWMFVYSADYDEVECIYQPCGNDLWGEPWTVIAVEQSPFAIKDKDKVAELIDDLTKIEYKYNDNYTYTSKYKYKHKYRSKDTCAYYYN